MLLGYGSRTRNASAKRFKGRHQRGDTRVEWGKSLAPYGRFDAEIERFCCCTCGYQAQTLRGISVHLEEAKCSHDNSTAALTGSA
jgi:hypothetical protein